MLCKILQLNIWKGAYLDDVGDFLLKENFDIINLQEVAGAPLSPRSRDNFAYIQNLLEQTHTGIFATEITTTLGSHSFEGNATFYKKDFTLVEEKILSLKDRSDPIDHEFLLSIQGTSHPFYEDLPRNCITLLLEKNNKSCWFLNTHLPWNPTPDDTPKKIRDTKVLLDFVASLDKPFILAGDFNVDSRSQIVKTLEKQAQNLNTMFHITNTLNHRLHRKKTIPDLAVDFILPSKDIVVKDFAVLNDLDLADHLALVADVEI